MSKRIPVSLQRLAFENHDHCTSCQYKFLESDRTYLGYDCKKKPLYVCAKCSNLLGETLQTQYFRPLSFERPEPNSKLWRYMDFAKYVSLLSSRGLYFTRSDCFEDSFEGAKGLKKNKVEWDDFYLEFFRGLISNPIRLPEGGEIIFPPKRTDEEIEQAAQKMLADMQKGGEDERKRVYVNCWHENKHESEAMWRLYSSFLANAVAVRTTYHSLYKSLGRDPNIKIGRIKYIDFKKDYAQINGAFWRKGKSLEHEREVRLLFQDFKHQELGKVIPCDLTILIEEIFVSPKAPLWFINLINEVNEKYGILLKVSKSELFEEPFF